MLRRISWLLCALILSACSLAPEETPAPKTVCPTCAAAPTCAACAPASTCPPAPQPSATYTPLPTNTSTPTLEPTATPLPTHTPMPTAAPPGALYLLQDGTPALLPNFAHPDLACQWMGVAGQVFTASGSPVDSLVVVLTGALNGVPLDMLGLTGSIVDYGQGGFEIQLASQPTASQGTLYLQLFDLAGNPVSDLVTFNTSANCNQNLVVINFQAAE